MTGGREDFPGAFPSPGGLREKAEIPRIFRQGVGGGLFARAAQKAPCFYRIPFGATSCGAEGVATQKAWFLLAPAARRRPSWPPAYPPPPTPPASPGEPQRGGGLWRVAAFALKRGRGGIGDAFCAERSGTRSEAGGRGKAPPRNRHSPGNRGIHKTAGRTKNLAAKKRTAKSRKQKIKSGGRKGRKAWIPRSSRGMTNKREPGNDEWARAGGWRA